MSAELFDDDHDGPQLRRKAWRLAWHELQEQFADNQDDEGSE